MNKIKQLIIISLFLLITGSTIAAQTGGLGPTGLPFGDDDEGTNLKYACKHEDLEGPNRGEKNTYDIINPSIGQTCSNDYHKTGAENNRDCRYWENPTF